MLFVGFPEKKLFMLCGIGNLKLGAIHLVRTQNLPKTRTFAYQG